jgi:hypothetical protein
MASPYLEKMQRIAPLVPVNDEFYLRRKDRFDKSARKNIYRNCLLPVLSLLPSFECFSACRFNEAANAVQTARKISRGRL